MFITHQSDPATVEGIARVDSERKAAQEALKMSSLSDAKVYRRRRPGWVFDRVSGERGTRSTQPR